MRVPTARHDHSPELRPLRGRPDDMQSRAAPITPAWAWPVMRTATFFPAGPPMCKAAGAVDVHSRTD